MVAYKNISAIFIHQVATFVAPWVTVYIAGNTQGENYLGLVSFWMAIAIPLSIFCCIPSRNYLLVNLEISDDKIYLHRFIILIIFCLVIFFFNSDKNIKYLPHLLLFAKFSELMFDVPVAKMMKRNETNNLIKLGSLRFVVLSISVLVGIKTDSVIFFLAIFTAGNFVLALSKRDRMGIAITPSILFSSITMAFSSAIIAIQSNIPRYLLGHFGDFEKLSYFACGAFIVTALSVFINIVVQNNLTLLSTLFNEKNYKKINTLILKLLLLGSGLWLGFFIFSIFPTAVDMYYSIYGLNGENNAASDLLIFNTLFGLLGVFQSVGAGLMLASGSIKKQFVSSLLFLLIASASSYISYQYYGYLYSLISLLVVTLMQIVANFMHATRFSNY